MPISDLNPDTTQADTAELCAAKLQRTLKRAVRAARQAVVRANIIAANCPGGQAALNTALASTQSEAAAIINKLAVLVNTHKATGSDDVTNPLL